MAQSWMVKDRTARKGRTIPGR